MGLGFGEHRAALDACIYAGALALARALFALGHRLANPPTKEHP